MTFALFQKSGKLPSDSDLLKIRESGMDSTEAASFKTRGLIRSGPHAFDVSILRSIFLTSFAVICTSSILLIGSFISRLGRTLVLSAIEDCKQKYAFKIFALSISFP